MFDEPVNGTALLKKVERACRTCYKSEGNITEDSAPKLIGHCLAAQHESVLEHSSITFRIVCSRSTLAQWTRHRLASYSVESQRYCNYTKDRFNNQVVFVVPTWLEDSTTIDDEGKLVTTAEVGEAFAAAACDSELNYGMLINFYGCKPEQARMVLPNCAKTEMVCTMNLREIRHFISLRGSEHADPDIRKLAIQMKQLLEDAGLGIITADLAVAG